MSTDTILEEVERALERPYFAKRPAESDRLEYLTLIRREALIISPRTDVRGIARDPADDHVLAAATDGDARYLVTGDHDLVVLGVFRGIAIVTARTLIDSLNAELPTS